FQVNETLAADGPARELVGGQIPLPPQVAHAGFDLCRQQRAFDRRIQARDQKTMVTAGIAAGDGAAGKAAQTVGHQPLVAAGALPAAADMSAQYHENTIAPAARGGGGRRGFQARQDRYRSLFATARAAIACRIPGLTRLDVYGAGFA